MAHRAHKSNCQQLERPDCVPLRNLTVCACVCMHVYTSTHCASKP